MNRDDQIELLLTKGVEQILPSTNFLKAKLEKGEQIKVYMGIDPTGPSLHIGHVIQLRKLRQFQDLGHQVIFLMGDFTARIGDPTDKMATRVQLTDQEVKTNLRLYKKQAGNFIRFTGSNSAKILFNAKWLSKLRFADVLELASHMTVDQMLKRDMFARRTEDGKPIYIHEFMYPLMQGYDSVAMNVDGEIGGNDQLFNMLAGRTLLKKIKDKEKFVITVKLLADNAGEKMGKTTGNMIALTDAPRDIFGKIMSWTDGMIVPGFELCTDFTLKETEEVSNQLKNGGSPRDIKMKLAYEITKTISGEKDALKAQEYFVSSFQNKENPQDVKAVNGLATGKETLLSSGEVTSASELRTLVISGSIASTTTGEKLTLDDLKKPLKKDTYRIGKHRFIKII